MRDDCSGSEEVASLCWLYLENGRYMNSFKEYKLLGKGGFGEAHLVKHFLDGNYYCVKKIRLHLAENEVITDHKVYREIMALPSYNHKNVVRYYTCWVEKVN